MMYPLLKSQIPKSRQIYPEYSLANGPTLEPFSPEAGPSWVRSSHRWGCSQAAVLLAMQVRKKGLYRGTPLIRNPPPRRTLPTAAICLGTYGGPRVVGVSSERGTPVILALRKRLLIRALGMVPVRTLQPRWGVHTGVPRSLKTAPT